MRVVFGGLIAATAAIFGITPPAMARSDTFKSYGDVFRYALPAAAVGLSLGKGDREGLKQFAIDGAVTMGLTVALKYAVNERRPNGGKHSFPSGHTSAAFLGAAYIHQRYGWQLGFPASVLAAAVGVSRVDAKAHHWRDVIASTLIAETAAYTLISAHDRGVRIAPWSDGSRRSVGLAGRINF